MTQLFLEYDPLPPFNAGTPDKAEQTIVKSLREFGKPVIEAFLTQVKSSLI